MTDILIYAFFVNATSNVGETGLSPTIDIYRVTKADLTSLLVVNNQAMTELAGGFYGYLLASGDLGTYDYISKCKTVSSDVISNEVAAIRWEDAWNESPRTLTQSAASVISSVTGDSVTDIRGNDWSIELDTSQDFTGKSLQFAIKNKFTDADTAAILFIDSTGLVYLNGAAGTSGQGSYTVTDAGEGQVTITVDALATAQLGIGNYTYGIQEIADSGGAVTENVQGTFTVTADVVKATT